MIIKPLVSVIMPAYNAERYIAEAIQSILDQTYSRFELIIINDCSQDHTLDVVKRFALKDKRIKVFSNDENLKLSKSLNRGIRESRGKYIARMDADDVSLPTRLEEQVIYMEEHPDVGILGAPMNIVNEKGDLIGKREYLKKDADIRKKIFYFSPFCHPVIMLRKSVLNKSGLYDHYYNPAEDYDLYFRVGKYSKFANLSVPLINYRVIENSMTTGGMKRMERKTIEIRKKYFQDYNADIKVKFYNFCHLVSTYILPRKLKMNIFIKLRSSRKLLGAK